MGPEVGNGPPMKYWGTPGYGQIHTCENITFPHPSDAVGNERKYTKEDNSQKNKYEYHITKCLILGPQQGRMELPAGVCLVLFWLRNVLFSNRAKMCIATLLL